MAKKIASKKAAPVKATAKTPLECPKSVTNIFVNLMGVWCFFLAIICMRSVFPDTHYVLIGTIAMAASLLPILYWDMRVQRVYESASVGLQPSSKDVNFERILIKLVGLVATFAVIAFFYWAFAEYRGSFYDNYYLFLSYLIPVVLFFSWAYFAEMDRRMKEPHDGYYAMGCVALLQWDRVKIEVLKEHWRAWLIKAFFLPLMFTYFINNINFLMTVNMGNITQHFGAFFQIFISLFFVIDILFACLGYIFTFKIFDTHIRSAEPTMFGWFICLLCYEPFWGMIFRPQYMEYETGYSWQRWFYEMGSWAEPLMWLWGITILILTFIFGFSTAALGHRFSNLTFRGLVTCGPYRISKHPAYLSKCLSWWLMSVPFILHGQGFWEMLRDCAMLSLLCYVYFLRARTEENHLSNYPEYVQYANWMNEHGLLRWVGKKIPYFAYSEVRAKTSGSIAWWRKEQFKEMLKGLK